MANPYIISSISQAHSVMGLATPRHPLVSVVQARDMRATIDFQGLKVINWSSPKKLDR